MWFGTFNGLNRYDGIKTKIYLGDENDSSTINNNNIYDIFEGMDGDLWIKGIDTVFNVYNKDKGIFVDDFDEIKARYQLKSKGISKIFKDSQGRFWFLHPHNGLTIYNQGKEESRYLISDAAVEGSLSGNNVTDIQEDASGKFWLVYDNGTIDVLSGSSFKVDHRILIGEVLSHTQKYDLKITLDTEGDAWVYCPNHAFGAFLIDHKDFSVANINENF
ncbi:two-component system sensor histidine kinase/response regulator, hybrid ('one-component system') [Cyclobacterium qasimii M12-11B]|uniref:Two-component system sensor histidine kinase/response regulator, hybrid ('one-component system') n=2 Tax=Cyclobacterium qasimii TaxID=1350429 RepID=S7VDL8_9BACT|nr:two-component system sensor histidine kinase/response regulator, hybrid ('one-component system') [Cyclobacterium qasimii M12-11B]